MQPQILDEYTHNQLENNGNATYLPYDINASAIMPRNGQNLSIMPAQTTTFPEQRQIRAESSHGHEHCDAEFLKLDKRLKEYERHISQSKEQSEQMQGQNLVLMSELNKQKERAQQIETVMFMALSLLVNVAGINTGSQAA